MKGNGIFQAGAHELMLRRLLCSSWSGSMLGLADHVSRVASQRTGAACGWSEQKSDRVSENQVKRKPNRMTCGDVIRSDRGGGGQSLASGIKVRQRIGAQIWDLIRPGMNLEQRFRDEKCKECDVILSFCHFEGSKNKRMSCTSGPARCDELSAMCGLQKGYSMWFPVAKIMFCRRRRNF